MQNDDEIEDLFWNAIETFPAHRRGDATDWLTKQIAAANLITDLQTKGLGALLPSDGE